jgi:hypothetical protein
MNSTIRKAERISLDDFEELLLDRPEDEKWELIDGVLVKGMVGARASGWSAPERWAWLYAVDGSSILPDRTTRSAATSDVILF